MLDVDYVVSGAVRTLGRAPRGHVELVETRTTRDRLGGDASTSRATTRCWCSTRSATASSPRSPSEIETRGAQPRHPQAADLARRVGGATTAACGTCTASRAPTTSRRGTSSAPRSSSIRRSRAPTPASRSRTGRTPSRAGRNASREIDRALDAAGAGRAGRRSRSGGALGAWAARSGCGATTTQSVMELEQSVDLSPNFALGALHARVRAGAERRSGSRDRRRPTTRGD